MKFKKTISHWSHLIKISTTGDFYASFERFASLYNPNFIKYVKKVWLPLAPRFVNAWKKKLPHFDHQTTSRIESSHAYIKTCLLNCQASLPEVFKFITLALKDQNHEIKSQFHQQKITHLQNVHSIFVDTHGKITNYAIQVAQN